MNKVKKISALIGVILILLVFAVTLIAAIFATEYAPGLFMASVFSIIIIPILIYLFLMVYQRIHRDEPFIEEARKKLEKKD